MDHLRRWNLSRYSLHRDYTSPLRNPNLGHNIRAISVFNLSVFTSHSPSSRWRAWSKTAVEDPSLYAWKESQRFRTKEHWRYWTWKGVRSALSVSSAAAFTSNSQLLTSGSVFSFCFLFFLSSSTGFFSIEYSSLSSLSYCWCELNLLMIWGLFKLYGLSLLGYV